MLCYAMLCYGGVRFCLARRYFLVEVVGSFLSYEVSGDALCVRSVVSVVVSDNVAIFVICDIAGVVPCIYHAQSY